MISEIDTALRDLFYAEIPLRKGEVDVEFDQPKREWSSRLNKPTLNLYLFDLKENVDLRGAEQWNRTDLENGMVALRRNPVRIDLEYLITSWAKEVLDEHQLLSKALVMLLRKPYLPEEYLSETLKNQLGKIWLETAQSTILANPHDFWTTLGNDLRPGIRLKVTISLEPTTPLIVPSVSTTEIGFMQNPTSEQADDTLGQRSSSASASKSYFAVRGKITSPKYSPSSLKITIAESGRNVELNEAGEFAVGSLESGEYHLDITANGRALKRQKMVVPSPTYQFEV